MISKPSPYRRRLLCMSHASVVRCGMCCVVCVGAYTMCTSGCISTDDTDWDRYTHGVHLLTHASLWCTCGADCERSCGVDAVPAAGICDTGGCRRSCIPDYSTVARVAAVVVQSIHWMMKPIQPMPWRNYDANYVSHYNVYNSAGGGSTETIDG